MATFVKAMVVVFSRVIPLKNRKGVIFSVPKRVNCLFVSQFLLFSTMLVGYRLVRIYVLQKVVFRPTRLSPVSVLLRYMKGVLYFNCLYTARHEGS